MESANSSETVLSEDAVSRRKQRNRTFSPPAFIETNCQDLVPPLGELDATTSEVRRSYGMLRYLAHAFMLYVAFLALSVTKAKVQEQEAFLLFNSTVFPQFDQHWNRIHQSIRNSQTAHPTVGAKLAQQGASVHYPIVMIPGFVTSGLELWAGHECAAKKYFRQRLWGALGTATQFFTDTECWRLHLALDEETGMDPPGIRLRAAQGFEAADYFMTAYWVWNKLIDNLAAVGYDGSTMSMEAYDWRLSFPLLEERDGYFTKLRHKIEAMHETTSTKVVICAHSMGSPLMTYFFKWVSTSKVNGGGGGGEDWVEEHVHALVNIAGPMMGVPKAVPSILSGEMKDTNVLMGTFGSMLEQFFGRRKRKELWSSWGSLWGMLPKGGHELWGVGADICPEGSFPGGEGLECVQAGNETGSTAPFISMSQQEMHHHNDECDASGQDQLQQIISTYANKKTWSVDVTMGFLSEWGAGYGADHAGPKQHSFDKSVTDSPRSWGDPTVTSLPDAPSLHIYCLYGVGLDTERSFYYKQNVEDNNETQSPSMPTDLPFIMDGSVMDPEQNITYGVKMVDGDASVPLLSLGYMCVDGWKKPFLNPSKSKVTTREYQHQQEFLVDDPMRGGPKSGDHVDILGNVDMTEDFVRIVTNFEVDKVGTRIVSDIENIAERINKHPMGGLKYERPVDTIGRIRSAFGY